MQWFKSLATKKRMHDNVCYKNNWHHVGATRNLGHSEVCARRRGGRRLPKSVVDVRGFVAVLFGITRRPLAHELTVHPENSVVS